MTPRVKQILYLVHSRLEVLNVEGVVLLTMNTEVLDLVKGNGLVLVVALVGGLVTLRIGTEGP